MLMLMLCEVNFDGRAQLETEGSLICDWQVYGSLL